MVSREPPHSDVKSYFKNLPENVLEYIALRNSSLHEDDRGRQRRGEILPRAV
jgi:hypothetical protein